MIRDCLKITTYFSERDRVERRFLADALLDLYASERVLASVVLRGVEGFGPTRELQTERLLTLAEDLPYVTTAVDSPERIEPLLPRVLDLCRHGLVTLERGRMIAGAFEEVELAEGPHEAVKLTVLVGRGERAAGGPAHRAVVSLMRTHGLAGASALLGVDGTAHGERERARFFGGNASVPVAVVAVGSAAAMAGLLPRLDEVLARPLLLLERVQVCKIAGTRLGEPGPEATKLMVHAPEHAQHDGAPLYAALIRRLREAGASGATALRGFWGYHGDQAPHGDGLLSPRRRVPVVVSVIDTPQRTRAWFEIVDSVTTRSGLVTSEIVPVAHPR